MKTLLTTAYNNWVADRVPQTAAGLAYYTVFSLAPLLLIATGIAGLFFGHDQARAQILDQVTAIMGSFSRDAVERLMGSADEAQRAGIISTITGGVTLLIGAVGVLIQLKYALNTVWDVEASASTWGDMIKTYLTTFALVVATGFLLLVSLVLTAVVGATTAVLRSWLSGPDVLWVALDAIFGIVMATGVFALIFKLVPDAHVAWRDVWGGALFTALLFTVGRLGLGWYLGREGADSVYSAAGSLLAMLTWIYYSAQIVLFGAEVTHVYAKQRGSRASRPSDRHE